MKLQMNDSAKTIITEIKNKEILTRGDYKYNDTECGHYYYIKVNGMDLIYSGVETLKRCKKDLNKLLRAGFEKKWEPTLSEEERGWADGMAADMADPAQHGRCLAKCLAGENSSALYWDYYQQKCVNSVEELTIETAEIYVGFGFRRVFVTASGVFNKMGDRIKITLGQFSSDHSWLYVGNTMLVEWCDMRPEDREFILKHQK